MVKGLALGVKFSICLEPPGPDYREEWPPPSCLFLGSNLSQGQGAAAVNLRQCLQTPSLPFWAGAGHQLSLITEKHFTGLSLKSNWMELT